MTLATNAGALSSATWIAANDRGFSAVSDELPCQEDENDPLDRLAKLIRDGPPPTTEAKAKYVDEYMAELRAIAQAHSDDPLLASERVLSASMALAAGLSPPGSSGPADLFTPLMEVVLALQWGASLDKTALFKSTPGRGKGRPPTPPALKLGQARAAAVVTMLMEAGLTKHDAVQRVAGRLERAGISFDRANANPANTVEYWRAEAMRPGPMNVAYLDALTKLQARITPDNTGSAQQVFMKALDELVAQGLFE